MAIIISKNGENAKKVDRSRFESEDSLQKYIYSNPDSIPLYDFKDEVRLLILAREFPTNSGPIDAIGTDKDGEIYLIETKLYKNPDKRLVISQVLDYGASLWRSSLDFNEFLKKLDDQVNAKFNVGLHQKLQAFFGIDEDQTSLLIESMEKNLNEGNFKFVVLMDQLHNQLKDLIVFINENSRFDVFAVELEYYEHDTFEIMIPKLFGAEVKKDIGISSTGSRKQWDKESFFNEVNELLDKKGIKIISDVYEFAKKKGEVIWGRGMMGTFNMKIKKGDNLIGLFCVFSKGRSWIGIGHIAKYAGKEIAAWLVNEIKNIGIVVPADKDMAHVYPEFCITDFNDKQITNFKKIIDNLCKKIKEGK